MEYRGAYYVATASKIFMSLDRASTWSSQKMPRYFNARIRCRLETCFALLSQLGSEWSGVFSVPVRRNDWKELGALSLPLVAKALEPLAANRSAVKQFGATDLLPTEDGVFIAGIVNAGDKPWGAVLLVDKNGNLQAIGSAVDDGLWRLERDPMGTLWAGGQGAFQLRAGKWVRVWSGE